ncbi:MAG: hypothetical protein JJT95_11250 [Pararhodobacter sp.]|nr:hypothetical protein [Pararhodobacter sp.]
MMLLGYVIGTTAAHLLAWELWLTAIAAALLPIPSIFSGAISGLVYSSFNFLAVSRMMSDIGSPPPSVAEAIVPFFSAAIVGALLSIVIRRLRAPKEAAK